MICLHMQNVPTRGHSKKVVIKRSRLDIRKFFFTNRVAPIWNSLPDAIVCCASVDVFKKSLYNVNFDTFLKGGAL